MSAPRTPEKYTASSAGTPVLGTPGSNAGATTVRWDLTPVEVPLHQLHYASEAALNGAPLLIRGRCDKTASMGLTKAGAPFYTLSLISLQEETSANGSGTSFYHRIRLVAFGEDAPRTSGVLLKDNVIDVIHPRVARANPQWATDSTVPYELRVAADTQVRVFREDPKNLIAEYTIKEIQGFTAAKQTLVSVRGKITKILPYNGSKNEAYGYREIWLSDRNENTVKITIEKDIARTLSTEKLGKMLHIGPLRPSFYLEQFQGISLETVPDATRVISLLEPDAASTDDSPSTVTSQGPPAAQASQEGAATTPAPPSTKPLTGSAAEMAEEEAPGDVQPPTPAEGVAQPPVQTSPPATLEAAATTPTTPAVAATPRPAHIKIEAEEEAAAEFKRNKKRRNA